MEYRHSIYEMLKGNEVHFSFFQDGKAFYTLRVEDTEYEFPVPIEDIGTGVLLRDDRAMLYLKWVRKAVESEEMRQKTITQECEHCKQIGVI